MIQLRGNNKGCVVVTGDGEEYKFRSGEHEGLRELVKHMNKNLFEEQTHLLEKEYKEAIEWLHEFQEELPRLPHSGESVPDNSTLPFIVGRKYDDWAVEILGECEDSIGYIEKTLTDPEVSEDRKRILRSMRSDLIYTIDLLKEGTEIQRYPIESKAKERREVYLNLDEMADIYPVEEDIERAGLLREKIEEMYTQAGLTPREREVFEMKHGAMMREDEIADLLGVTQKTVHGILSRIRRKLRVVQK
jgi:RNA polymerase sigma factor (sigma-70 family)